MYAYFIFSKQNSQRMNSKKNDEGYEDNDAYFRDNACNMDLFSIRYSRKYLILDSNVEDLKLVALRSIRAKPDHPCQKKNGGCSHICAARPKRAVS